MRFVCCKNFKVLRLAHTCLAHQFGGIPLKTSPNLRLQPLENRQLIRVAGNDVIPFLQGLVTNDVSRFLSSDSPPSMYALFLNKGGRILYDTIIYRTNDPDIYLLECDKDASIEFCRHLCTYRVRRKIDIDSVEDEYEPWVMFNERERVRLEGTPKSVELFVAPDPRLSTLGTRILAPTGTSLARLVENFWRSSEVSTTADTVDSNYRLLRYKQGVAEGVTELPPGKCFPLEANADFLNGVSFNKGCYIGQELTARVHHSGVIRKRYMPLRLTSNMRESPNTVKSLAGANLGTVFGQAGDRALALLRVDQVLNSSQELCIDGERCYAEKPSWWPNQLSHKKRIVNME